MAILYKVSGYTLENSVAASNWIAVYKADRSDQPSMGEMLASGLSDANGVFELTWNDWAGEIFVVAADPTAATKYETKIYDWLYGQTAGYDPLYNNVVSLMHMTGANDGQVVLDEVTENVITVVGDAKTSTVTSKFGGSSLRLDGDKDWLVLPYRSEFQLEYQDWCLEMWVRLDAVSGYQTFFDSRSQAAGDTHCPILFRSNGANLEMYVGKTSSSWKGWNSAPGLQADVWHHVAGTADSGVYRLFLDGIQIDSFIEGSPVMTHSRDITIGCRDQFGEPMTGYIDDLRWTIGAPRYVTNFSVPSEEFHGNIDPYFTQVVSLLHMDGTDDGTIFVDEIGHACAAVGNARTKTDHFKFGGSSLFSDGNSDRVTITYDNSFLLGTDDFTIECWLRVQAYDGTSAIWANRISTQYGQFLLHLNSSGALYAYFQKATSQWFSLNTGSAAIPLNQWKHIAVTRRGQTFTLFVDGEQLVSSIFADPIISPVQNNIFLMSESNGGNCLHGHMDDFRLTVGTSRYNDDFAPPTKQHPDS